MTESRSLGAYTSLRLPRPVAELFQLFTSSPKLFTMTTPSNEPPLENHAGASPTESLYATYTRFELELEFVQSLSNPLYLNHLATQKLLQDPAFINYLHYLLYFARSEYTKFLLYPGPTLKVLGLLQEERFRRDIMSPEVVNRLMVEWMAQSTRM